MHRLMTIPHVQVFHGGLDSSLKVDEPWIPRQLFRDIFLVNCVLLGRGSTVLFSPLLVSFPKFLFNSPLDRNTTFINSSGFLVL
ncbi:hypothetical protein BABINDRAFT_97860 [Babjeviella inositovora NRRL Y-12698]|uniref:Uncharacterized protein n=1 Tax=Babjeviella inositovora NRRL Y-12698 TaxID=984486 RepID=A0A1E3QJ44_9ASCO|nr:uncharacterized protein BABINDRAFT_97860 [Babjeviella inositovora NRRL Y-12698]ODQ77726.1 hypothetical protein BABINDRAFT_97860 [Babjeviella inositovora NRRL Y-12698]